MRASVAPGLRIYDLELFEQLQKAAVRNGRSLNAELAARLAASVEAEKHNSNKKEAA